MEIHLTEYLLIRLHERNPGMDPRHFPPIIFFIVLHETNVGDRIRREQSVRQKDMRGVY